MKALSMKSEFTFSSNFTWVDVTNPTEDELQTLTETYQLHPLLIKDCLDPEHLPKFEELEEGFFIILRAYDVEKGAEGVTIQEMTRKVAIFVREQVIITIHRAPLPFIFKLQEDLKVRAKNPPANLYIFLSDLCKRSTLTFDKALVAAEEDLERLEELVSIQIESENTVVKLHHIRRRLLCMKRLSWHLTTVVQRIPFPKDKKYMTFFTDLKEELDSFGFFADELLDDATSLSNLEMALAARRVNEIIRTLTLFSVFFMPLTFIVGIYGMNFKYMPELELPLGYPAIMVFMLIVAFLIYFWFRKKRWLP